MSVAPGMKIKKYLGIVDVHTIRMIKIIGQTDQVPAIIEQVIEETNEIAKARVESLGGNCLLSLRTDINTIDQTMQSQLYVIISCFGDVVYVEPENNDE